MAIVLFDFAASRTANRRVRKPTNEQITDFASAIGSMVARHWDLSGALGGDLLDIAEAGGAIGEWLADGPVLGLAHPEVAYLDGDPQSEGDYLPPEDPRSGGLPTMDEPLYPHQAGPKIGNVSYLP